MDFAAASLAFLAFAPGFARSATTASFAACGPLPLPRLAAFFVAVYTEGLRRLYMRTEIGLYLAFGRKTKGETCTDGEAVERAMT